MTHHWTGIIVAVVLLGAQLVAVVSGRRDAWNWPTLIGSALLVAANLSFGRLSDGDYQTTANHHYQVYAENGPYSYDLADFVYGNAQGLAGIVCLALLCVAAWRVRSVGSTADA